MEDKTVEKYHIKKVIDNKIHNENDSIIKEQPLTIFVNGYELVTLMTLPLNLKELAVGFIASENIIDDYNEINAINFSHQDTVVQIELNKEVNINLYKKRTLTSGCGKGVTFTNLQDCALAEVYNDSFKINSSIINKLMSEMQKKSDLFLKTGGTHTAALADQDSIISVIEDIGRHNTIDKLIGFSYQNKITLKDKMIITSGRVSSEIIIKVLKQKIPILISRSAPTSQAVEIAREKNITLVGFTRGNRYNVYNDLDRIKL
ncbi:MAG: formate dehydrogenase accessory sulfurtransferase FdhD [Bacillota bacterium]